MNNSIAAIVVTYNRKELLIKCLNAIINQTYKPNAILIVDNCSTDGTPEILFQNKYIAKLPNHSSAKDQTIEADFLDQDCRGIIKIKYIRKWKNEGGAGGFYEGMKHAYDDGFEWLWLMDDDGIPQQDQLKTLFEASVKNNLFFTNSLVVDIEDKTKLAFGLNNYKFINEVLENEIIYDTINPFNGTFINRYVPEKIGFIKKEMFIWGDETEYMLRAKLNNFEMATIKDAIHYHPKTKSNFIYVIPQLKLLQIILKPRDKQNIYFKNLGFIQKTYFKKRSILFSLIKYSLYFLLKFRIQEYKEFIISYYEGMNNKFIK